MNKNQEISDMAYNNFIFNKFNISDKEFNDFSDDIKYKHLQMFSNKINDTQKRKVIVSDSASWYLMSSWEKWKMNTINYRI